MIFEAAKQGKNEFWRFVIVILVTIFTTIFIGNIPLLAAITAKMSQQGPEMLEAATDNPADLSVYGIDPLAGLLYVIVPFGFGLAALWITSKPVHYRPFMSMVTGAGKFRKGHFSFAFALWFLFSGLYLLLSLLFYPGSIHLNPESGRLFLLVIIALLFIPVQTSFEEVFFRGYLMQGFGLLFRNRWSALLITSVGFGLLHSFNPEIEAFGFWEMMPQYIFFGLVFGVLTLFSGGTELALGMHAANNVFAAIFVTHPSSTLQTPAVFEQTAVFPLFDFATLSFFAVVFFLVAKTKYRWKDWSVLYGRLG